MMHMARKHGVWTISKESFNLFPVRQIGITQGDGALCNHPQWFMQKQQCPACGIVLLEILFQPRQLLIANLIPGVF